MDTDDTSTNCLSYCGAIRGPSYVELAVAGAAQWLSFFRLSADGSCTSTLDEQHGIQAEGQYVADA